MRSQKAMELIPISGAEIYYGPPLLQTEEATQLFNTLLVKCAWERRRANYGHAVPRDEAYYGDAGTHYTYSRRKYQPLPWLPELLSLKTRVEEATPDAAYANSGVARTGYNAVLCNRYLDGNDSVPLHADAELEMGPVIASVTLIAPGADRLFLLRRKDGSVAFSERLPHGSLLIMAGDTQKNFRHEVPKEPAVTLPRINLTFRRIERK
jgi:alkylated DNA repair dioxygenase AlkB